MIIEKQYISADEFLKIVEEPPYHDRAMELIQGEIIEMPLTNGEHGEILSLMHAKIASHVYDNGLGRVTVGDAGFVLERNPTGRDTVRGLDIAFVSGAKSPEPLPDGFIEVSPDLAVEVVSPSNEAADIHLKVLQLLKAGTSLVWVVYPDSQTVVAHTPSGSKTLQINDKLSGGEILPGLEIPLRAIFPS